MNPGDPNRRQAAGEPDKQDPDAQRLLAIGSFASAAAHDFNNLLSAILGNVDLARSELGTSSPGILESLNEIEKAAGRAQELVRQIVELRRAARMGDPPRKAEDLPQAGPGSDRRAAESIRRRILYVDDDDALVFLMRRLLERSGLIVDAYTSADEALEKLRTDPAGYCLALSDLNMPGMSGLEFAREALRIRADLPVVIASGYVDDRLRAEAAAAGVRELLLKSYSVEDFCQHVLRFIAATEG